MKLEINALRENMQFMITYYDQIYVIQIQLDIVFQQMSTFLEYPVGLHSVSSVPKYLTVIREKI